MKTIGIKTMCFSLHIGFVVRWKIFDPPTREQMYDDADYWEVSLFFSLSLSLVLLL